MQIEGDTCYVRHFARTDEEFVFLTHYIEVWENGYTVDDYIIYNEDIYYENAGHHGVDPDEKYAGTYIMKKQYLRWTRQIEQAKETAVKMLQQTASPINRNLEVGDFIFYTWIDDEEDEEFRYDNAYYGMRIVEIKDDCLFVQNILIGEHSFDSCDDVRCHESLNDILRNSCFITSEAFISTHDYMRNFCKHLLEEIKIHDRTTEQI